MKPRPHHLRQLPQLAIAGILPKPKRILRRDALPRLHLVPNPHQCQPVRAHTPQSIPGRNPFMRHLGTPLKGHGFSRANICGQCKWALAP